MQLCFCPSARRNRRWSAPPSCTTPFIWRLRRSIRFTPATSLQLAGLAGQRVYYEPLYQEIVEYASVQPGMPFSTMEWCSVENYAHVYTELLAGRGMFLFPVRYPSYPAAWYRQVWLPLPDTVLLTLREDPRPEILTLRQVFTEVYGERIKALLP